MEFLSLPLINMQNVSVVTRNFNKEQPKSNNQAIFRQPRGKTFYDSDLDMDSLPHCYAICTTGERIVKVEENNKVTYRLITLQDLDVIEKIVAKEVLKYISMGMVRIHKFESYTKIPCSVYTYPNNDEDSFCLFDGWASSMLNDYNMEQIQPILDYIMNFLANKDMQRYNQIIQFMARMLQNPGESPYVCPLFSSLPDRTKDDFWWWFGSSILGIDRVKYCTKYTRDLDLLRIHRLSADSIHLRSEGSTLNSMIDIPQIYHEISKIKLCIVKIRDAENFHDWNETIRKSRCTNFVILSNNPFVRLEGEIQTIHPNIQFLTQEIIDGLYGAMFQPETPNAFFTFLMNLPIEEGLVLTPSPSLSEEDLYKIFHKENADIQILPNR